jgi:hypothetical protein
MDARLHKHFPNSYCAHVLAALSLIFGMLAKVRSLFFDTSRCAGRVQGSFSRVCRLLSANRPHSP